jgi:alpha-L-glutamate ligase-like protein
VIGRRRRLPVGINARNRVIGRDNDPAAIAAVRDKLETKRLLLAAGVPTAPTVTVIADRVGLARFDPTRLPETWVMKPACSSQGRGVLVGSRAMPPDRIRRHAERIVAGELSDLDGDAALIEPLLRPHPDLAPAGLGLPDVRVVVHRGTPLLAMVRLPTAASGGRSNLHQGGIGAAVDLSSGLITRARRHGQAIELHPDDGRPLLGRAVPHWTEIVELAVRCGPATGLGYLGVDAVVDIELGPLVLEVNSHPGLEIQNVCGVPLPLG